MARFYCPLPLVSGQAVSLPPTAARHVQVLRLQPGQVVTLFNGEGGEFSAEVQHMGRSDVRVVVGEHRKVECEAALQVHLAVGMPANERMDWLVEKATELGVCRITPLMTERSVVRLSGERVQKKQAHWQAIAASASEQCGRNRVPRIDEPQRLDVWLAQYTPVPREVKAVLSLHGCARALSALSSAPPNTPPNDLSSALSSTLPSAVTSTPPTTDAPLHWVLLSGPEGGLSDAEDAQARTLGFTPVRLGERVLRAETAALAALAWLSLR